MQKPSIGRIVHYVLTEQDAQAINRRRTDGPSIAERIKAAIWPLGAQAHIGNTAVAGEHVACVVVKPWTETTINGQGLLDGNDTLWVLSAQYSEDPKPGSWHWPEYVA